MPDGSLPTSVVRFTDTAGHVVGAGVLVGKREVLTCAHVVNLASGRDKLSGDQPREPVLVDFPGRTTISAEVRQWLPPPAREGAPGQDIAGLELAEDAPDDVTHASLITTLPGPGHEVDVFGYPGKPARPDGAWVRAVVRGQVGNGYLQLDAKSALQVQPGYSGSPVWDPVTGRVVGIIATAGRTTPDSYAITADLLRLSWPDALDRRRRGHDQALDRLNVVHLAGTRFRGEEGSDHLVDALHQDLDHLARDEGLRPDLLVVAGDLTERGLRTEFEQAVTFLDRLAEAVELPRDRVVVVPGTHDVNLVACRAYFLDMEAEQREPVRPYWRKWKQYSEAFDQYYRDVDVSFTPDEFWTFFTMPDLRVVVAGLNSTVADSHESDDGNAPEVDAAQLPRFAAHLEEYRAKGWLRLGVVHRPTPDVERTLVRPQLVNHLLTGTADADSYELVSFEKHGYTRHARRFEPAQGRWVGDTRVSPAGSDWRVRHEVSWGAVTRTFATATPPREKEQEQVHRPQATDSFFDRVEEATRISHPGATVTPYRENGYLRITKPTSGGGVEQWPVFVVAGDVTPDGIAEARDVHVRFAEHDRSVQSELVYGGEPATAALVADALSLGIRLRSWVDYQGLLDLRVQEQRQQKRLADDQVYPAALYVPQRYRVLDKRGTGDVQPDLLTKVLEWLSPDAARFVMVLGDFGRGKSFLLRQLARDLRSRLGNVSPVLVELRSLEKAPTLDELLTQHLVREGVEVLDVAKLRYMISSGRLALLFDGFDELELRVGYDNAAEYLRTLLVAVSDRAKVVLTSRSQHFRSHNQVLTALGDRVAAMSSSRVVVLEDFTDEQILDFLTRHYQGDAEQAERRYELLREVHDLLGLSRNPRMLAFIADLAEQRLRQVQEEQGRISAAELYRELVDFWLLHEAQRQEHPSGLRSLDELERLRVCTMLALRLWSSTAPTVQAADLDETVANTLTKLTERGYSAAQAVHAVGSGTLLVNTGDGFRFVHQSVMEWLVANAAAERVRDGGLPHMLDRLMSPLMVDFFCDLAGHEPALAWANRVTSTAGSTEVVRRNALAVRKRLGGTPQVDLSSLDLRRQDLSQVQLHGANLVGANLRGQRLTNVSLTNADLTDADLRDVRMIGGDLTGARLDRSDWRGAALLGVTGVGSAPELAAAAVVGRDPARVTIANSSIRALSYSPDGTLVALARGWGVELVDRASRIAIRSITGHLDNVLDVAFAPDGEHVATASDDDTARIWSIDGTPVVHLTGHRRAVVAVAFSPDGQLVATGSYDKSARIWTAEGAPVAHLTGHRGAVVAVAFSPDGKLVATASKDGTARVWTVGGEPVGEPITHGKWVRSVAFSPDGYLATGADDNTARVWTVDGQPVTTLHGHMDQINAVAYSPDGKHLATASKDGTVALWTGDGTRSAVFKGRASAGCRDVAFTADGAEVAVATYDAVSFWTPTGMPIGAYNRYVWAVRAVAFAPNGYSIATGTEKSAYIWRQDGATRINPSQVVLAVACTPDGRHVVTGSYNGVRVWTTGGDEVASYQGHDDRVGTIAVSPDGRQVVSASEDGTAHIWPVDADDPDFGVWVVLGKSEQLGRVNAVAFAPDSRHVATGHEDGIARIWTTGGRHVTTLKGHTRAVLGVAFSPDGRHIATASADTTVRLWDRDGKMISVLRGHEKWATAVVFSPDGTRLASASDDGTARIWMRLGRPVATLRGHVGAVRAVAFSPDGAYVATASDDGTTRVWSADGAESATLVTTDYGWAVVLPDGSYRVDGDVSGELWWAVKLTRFEEGELDPYVPEIRRMADDTPIPGIAPVTS